MVKVGPVELLLDAGQQEENDLRDAREANGVLLDVALRAHLLKVEPRRFLIRSFQSPLLLTIEVVQFHSIQEFAVLSDVLF